MHSDIYRNFHSMVSYSPYLSRSQSLFYQHHNCRPTLVDLSMTNYRLIKDKKLMLTLSWIYFRYFYGYGYAQHRYCIFLLRLICNDQLSLIDDTKHLMIFQEAFAFIPRSASSQIYRIECDWNRNEYENIASNNFGNFVKVSTLHFIKCHKKVQFYYHYSWLSILGHVLHQDTIVLLFCSSGKYP